MGPLTGGPPAGDRGADAAAPILAPEVRQRVIALASDLLGTLPDAEVPASLRRVAKFTPSRRGRLASGQIEAALEVDVTFRQRTGDRAATLLPELAGSLRTGRGAVDAEPVDRAALAYLLRPDGWRDVVAQATAELNQKVSSRRTMATAKLDGATRLREQLDAVRLEAHAEVDRLHREVADLRAESTKLRQRLGEARDRARVAESTARASLARAEAAEERGAGLARGLSDAEADASRLRQRVVDADVALETLRRSARDGRALESMRTRLLVDTLVEAAQGLRRELALPPLTTRPADLVVPASPASAGTDAVTGQGRDVDDPSLLRALLELPRIHLVVDGYNVTKSGYGDLSLQDQRVRLVGGLAWLAAQTGAEVTCVFDGAALANPVPFTVPRGVRVRFSPPTVTADDVIRDLVAAEPPGRPVAVVSSDREVAEGVRRTGARPVAARALLRLLDGR